MFTFSKQTPEEYAAKLKEYLGSSLRSVIVYGSSVSGEQTRAVPEHNLLVIIDRWGMLQLNQLAKATQQWLKEGSPAPVFFTQEHLQESADCFPIEMLDMKQSYRVVYGDDLLKSLKVELTHLRLITDREIKSLKIQLRQGFIFAGGDPKKVGELMVKTLSASLCLFRSALRLFTNVVPSKKYEVLPIIAEKVEGVDVEALMTIRQIKNGELKPSKVNLLNLFERYMKSIIAVGDAVKSPQKGT